MSKDWKHIKATAVCAALCVKGDYVISIRNSGCNVSYRPPGQHIHVGAFPTLREAQKAANKHAESLAS